jgi:hypothetical protein
MGGFASYRQDALGVAPLVMRPSEWTNTECKKAGVWSMSGRVLRPSATAILKLSPRLALFFPFKTAYTRLSPKPFAWDHSLTVTPFSAKAFLTDSVDVLTMICPN